MVDITPQVLIKAYSCGIFPMAECAEDHALYWIDPEQRGILPLDNFHIPKSLRKTIRKQKFEIRVDNNFNKIIDGCAQSKPGRRSTWINQRIRDLYGQLFRLGHCHTIEAWQNDKLVGGLYGVHIGGVFFGESMFSHVRDASKVALVYLIARLKRGNFELLDTQFVTDHLRQFGAIEVSRERFQGLLDGSLKVRSDFLGLSADASPDDILQLVSQTSNTGC